MSPEQTYNLTAGQCAALEEELKYLKTCQAREIAEMIAEARELGDLSENAEYLFAKEEEARLQRRIADLTFVLSHAFVVDEDGTGHPYAFAEE